MTKLFLSGPITGTPDYKKAFLHEQKIQEERGNIVFNPCSLPAGLSEADYMRICHAMIDCCDAIVMLYGWSQSEGALSEYYYAKKCDKRIWYKCRPTSLSVLEGKGGEKR